MSYRYFNQAWMCTYGKENPRLLDLLKNIAAALHRLGQTAEAAKVEERIEQLS